MSAIDLFTQYSLHLDPSSKAITYPPPSTPAVDTELTYLNTLHRSLLSLETPNNIPPPPLPINPKRSAQITKLRDTANTAYRKNNHPEAIKLYTLTIDMALSRPGWEPVALAREELAGLFANRAQAYMGMGKWVEGLVDARCSVECKGVGNVKGWWRAGRCLGEMGRWEEAKNVIEKGLELEGREGEGGKELLGLLEEVEEGLKRAAAS